MHRLHQGAEHVQYGISDGLAVFRERFHDPAANLFPKTRHGGEGGETGFRCDQSSESLKLGFNVFGMGHVQIGVAFHQGQQGGVDESLFILRKKPLLNSKISQKSSYCSKLNLKFPFSMLYITPYVIPFYNY